MRVAHLLSAVFFSLAPALAQSPSEPLGIALEGYAYPYPVRFLPLTVEQHAVRLAYMAVPPTAAANGRTVLLLHGRDFPASYWEPTIKALVQNSVLWALAERIGPLPRFPDDRCPTKPMNRAGIRSLGRATRSVTGQSTTGRCSSAAASRSGSRRRRSRPGTRPGELVRGAGPATTRTWRSRPGTCCAWPLVGRGGRPKACCAPSRPCSG